MPIVSRELRTQRNLMISLEIVNPPLPRAERQTRREVRCSVTLPLRLTTGSGEIIPAVILNISASGLLLLVDERTSLTLPPPRGSFLDGELFFDEMEIPQLTLEIVRIKRQGVRQLVLGCKFVDLPPPLTAAIRAKVTAHLTKPIAHKSR